VSQSCSYVDMGRKNCFRSSEYKTRKLWFPKSVVVAVLRNTKVKPTTTRAILNIGTAVHVRPCFKYVSRPRRKTRLRPFREITRVDSSSSKVICGWNEYNLTIKNLPKTFEARDVLAYLKQKVSGSDNIFLKHWWIRSLIKDKFTKNVDGQGW
jgi:hypothetical protein